MKTYKIQDNVFVLRDSYNNCSNLIIGREKALVFDTCLGVENIKEKVKELTRLPLVVINSHGHLDHVGGNTQFEFVYINPEDKRIFNNYNHQKVNKYLKAITGNKRSSLKSYDPEFNTRDLNFNSFDLGDLECTVIKLTGHTKGSIGIFVPRLKLLLSGDSLMPLMTLYFDNYASIDDQIDTLERVCGLDFDYYLTGHSKSLYSKSLVYKLKKCAYDSLTKEHQFYEFPAPPYSSGYLFKDNTDDKIGIIVAKHSNSKNYH